MFRKTGYIYGKVYITGWHFMDFPMPQVGDYELMVRGRYEGGDGPVRKIHLLGEAERIIMIFVCQFVSRCFLFLSSYTGKAWMITPSLSLLPLVLLSLCIMG